MAFNNDELPLPRAQGNGPGAARRTRSRALVFMVVSLVAGVGAAWLISRYLGQRGVAGRAQLSQVAVAAIDVPLGTALREEMISYVDWPTQALPKGAFRRGEPLAGRVVSKDFAEGEPFVSARVAATASGIGMAAVVPFELRAMTVAVNEVVGVSGFIHPNDLVDVISTMRIEAPGENRQDFRSKIVLQNIKVLAVGQQMDTQSDKPVKVPVVTLLVAPEESERLALASTQGKILLTLRSRADAEQVETAGVTPPELFDLAAAPPPRAAAPASAAPSAPVAARHPRPAKREVAAAPPKASPEVVEVLRGDRYEERKIRAKDDQP